MPINYLKNDLKDDLKDEHLNLTDWNLNLNLDEQTPTREESARKLYMAMTRAGQRLVLLASQPLPPALEQLFDVQR